jgi:hypothetical protein
MANTNLGVKVSVFNTEVSGKGVSTLLLGPNEQPEKQTKHKTNKISFKK